MSQYIAVLDQSARLIGERHNLPARLARYVLLALRVRAERRQLAMLSDAQLEDIGVSRADADREAGRPLLDIPAYRRSTLNL